MQIYYTKQKKYLSYNSFFFMMMCTVSVYGACNYNMTDCDVVPKFFKPTPALLCPALHEVKQVLAWGSRNEAGREKFKVH